MENLKNDKKLGFGFLVFIVIATFLAYDAGQTSGRDQERATFLDSAYISYCDNKGEYCYLDTKDGDKQINCKDRSRCLVLPE